MPGRVRGSLVGHGTKARPFMRPILVLTATFFPSLPPAFLVSSFLTAALASTAAHALAHLQYESAAAAAAAAAGRDGALAPWH